mmetsp:Transcript_21289/g.35208  ORF Transcript_21289/g.35208 Transcript_21289/m.35208 type:complete len:300 (-) Transcript_21289:539-1438(-)
MRCSFLSTPVAVFKHGIPAAFTSRLQHVRRRVGRNSPGWMPPSAAAGSSLCTIDVGILRCDVVPPVVAKITGEYEQMFKKLLSENDPAVKLTVFDATKSETPANTEDFDGFIITGSRHAAYDKTQQWILDLQETVRKLRTSRRPVFGVCFGHQIIAQALGGEVVKHSKGWEIGHAAFRVSSEAKKIMPAFEEKDELQLLYSHMDHVVKIPDGFVNMGGNDHSPIEGMISQDGQFLTVQGHPEFTPAVIEGYVEIRRGVTLPEDVASHALSTLNRPVDRDWIASQFISMLRKHKLHKLQS